MRILAGVAATLLVLGCASAPVVPVKGLSYEERLDALLRHRPDDPDLLFLRHDQRNLARCSKLAALRPTPVVLASVLSSFMSAGLDEQNLPEFERLLREWTDRDPENAMPRILKAHVAISRGDLNGGTDAIIHASHLPFLRTYSHEVQRETWRLLKSEQLDDIDWFGVVLARTHYNFTTAALGACSLLGVQAIDRELGSRLDEAIAYAEAEARLAQRFAEGNPGTTDRSVALGRLTWSRNRLCEVHLMRGDEGAAKLAAERAKQSWREGAALRRATQRDTFETPFRAAFEDAGLIERSDTDPGSRSFEETLSEFLERMATILVMPKEQWERFYQAVRDREATIRPYCEEQLAKGSAIAVLEKLTESDRNHLASLSPEMDRFWQDRSAFYSDTTRDRGERLIRWLQANDTEGYGELSEFMEERAYHALLHSADAAAVAKLEATFRAKPTPALAIILVKHGSRDPAVLKEVKESADEFNQMACWAAAQAGQTELIPEWVNLLSMELGSDRIYFRFTESVPVYLALRDLAGRDLGFNAEKWRAWATAEGLLKE